MNLSREAQLELIKLSQGGRDECPWCASDINAPICEAKDDETKLNCARLPGHDGPHVACDLFCHGMKKWED